jgi:hypothetical protein
LSKQLDQAAFIEQLSGPVLSHTGDTFGIIAVVIYSGERWEQATVGCSWAARV